MAEKEIESQRLADWADGKLSEEEAGAVEARHRDTAGIEDEPVRADAEHMHDVPMDWHVEPNPRPGPVRPPRYGGSGSRISAGVLLLGASAAPLAGIHP